MTSLLVLILGFSAVSTVQINQGHLHTVLHLISHLLKFFSSDFSGINLDGLFGLRIAQGQLIEAIEECSTRKSCPTVIMTLLIDFERKVENICRNSMPYVERADEDYFMRFFQIIDRPYLLPYKPTTFNAASLASVKAGWNKVYNEDKGDLCYAKLMGTYKEENGTMSGKCTVTPFCWDMMTDQSKLRYGVTHQLLYFILIQKIGCEYQIHHGIHHHNIQEIQTRICQKIYKESSSLASADEFLKNDKDLFLEQILLCGILGYEDFMNPYWMKKIFTWPDRNIGCFKQQPQYEDLVALIIGQAKSRESPHGTFRYNLAPTMRKLFRDSTMKDDCHSHTSGLGFGVFCTYLRYLIRYM